MDLSKITRISPFSDTERLNAFALAAFEEDLSFITAMESFVGDAKNNLAAYSAEDRFKIFRGAIDHAIITKYINDTL